MVAVTGFDGTEFVQVPKGLHLCGGIALGYGALKIFFFPEVNLPTVFTILPLEYTMGCLFVEYLPIHCVVQEMYEKLFLSPQH